MTACKWFPPALLLWSGHPWKTSQLWRTSVPSTPTSGWVLSLPLSLGSTLSSALHGGIQRGPLWPSQQAHALHT